MFHFCRSKPFFLSFCLRAGVNRSFPISRSDKAHDFPPTTHIGICFSPKKMTHRKGVSHARARSRPVNLATMTPSSSADLPQIFPGKTGGEEGGGGRYIARSIACLPSFPPPPSISLPLLRDTKIDEEEGGKRKEEEEETQLGMAAGSLRSGDQQRNEPTIPFRAFINSNSSPPTKKNPDFFFTLSKLSTPFLTPACNTSGVSFRSTLRLQKNFLEPFSIPATLLHHP